MVLSSLNDDLMVGMKVINQYVSTAPCNRGGFLGAVLYGILSALFDKTGAMIAAGFILVIGLTLLGSKFYLEHRKNVAERKRNPLKKILKCIKALVNSQIFLPLKKDKAKGFFPEEIFGDENTSSQEQDPPGKSSARIHTTHLEEDESVPSTFEFDEDSMTLEIKDKEPKIHENDMSKPKKKINKNYRLPALSLLKNPTAKKSGDNKGNALSKAESTNKCSS